MSDEIIAVAIRLQNLPVGFGAFLKSLMGKGSISLEEYSDENRLQVVRDDAPETEDTTGDTEAEDTTGDTEAEDTTGDTEAEDTTGDTEAEDTTGDTEAEDTTGDTLSFGRILWLGPFKDQDDDDDVMIAGMVALRPRERRAHFYVKKPDGTVTVSLQNNDIRQRKVSLFIYSETLDVIVFQYLERDGIGPRGFMNRLRGRYQRFVTTTRKDVRKGHPRKLWKQINEDISGKLDFRIISRVSAVDDLLKDVRGGSATCTLLTSQVVQDGLLTAKLKQKQVTLQVCDMPPGDERTDSWKGIIGYFKGLYKSARLTGTTDQGKTRAINLLRLERYVALDTKDYSKWLDETGNMEFKEVDFPIGTDKKIIAPLRALRDIMTANQALLRLRGEENAVST